VELQRSWDAWWGKRGRFRRLTGGLCLLLAVAAAGCGGSTPPSVVLITVSGLGSSDALDRAAGGGAGVEGPLAPRLAELASMATVYPTAYTTAPDTLAAHASLLTGLLPMEHGAGLPLATGGGDARRPLEAHFTTLAERMAARGYQTLAFVGHSDLARGRGIDQGFDHFDDAGGTSDEIVSRATQRIRESADEPFMLFVNFSQLVDPGATGDELRRIAAVDHAIGQLLDEIDRATAGRPILIAVTSDRGRFSAAAEQGPGQSPLNESSVRVPLIVRLPTAEGAGERVGGAKQNHRLHATILEIAGIPLPEALHLFPLDGRDTFIVTDDGRWNPARQGQSEEARPDAPIAWRAIYALPFKLVHASDGHYALFDLGPDPAARHDVSDVERKPASRLLKLLGQFSLKHGPLYDAALPDDANLWPDTEAALQAMGDVE
jgi:arylsulfatase A-like enzyme